MAVTPAKRSLGYWTMKASLLHTVLLRRQGRFRAHFAALGEQDVRAILDGEADVLLEILQRRYGYGNREAREAWNDFVLRYVDGEDGLPIWLAALEKRSSHRCRNFSRAERLLCHYARLQ